MEESLSKFISESVKRHEENSNLIREIRASTDAAIRNQGASIKTLEIQIGQMSKSISTTVEAAMTSIRRIGPSQYVVSAQQNRVIWTIMLGRLLLWSYMCQRLPTSKGEKPRSFTLPSYINNVFFEDALVDLGASISFMPLSTYLNLGTDIAKITRKEPKTGQNGHENGKSTQEPEIIKKSQPKSTLVNLGQLTN
nr:hypothetical protein [Tanacetum cinerariifolium]